MYDVNFGGWALFYSDGVGLACSDAMTLWEMEALFRSSALQGGNGVYGNEA